MEATKDIAGAKVENNKFCVSVHYRNVDPTVRTLSCSLTPDEFLLVYKNLLSIYFFSTVPCLRLLCVWSIFSLTVALYLFQKWSLVGGIVHNMLKDYPRLRFTYGRKVLM